MMLNHAITLQIRKDLTVQRMASVDEILAARPLVFSLYRLLHLTHLTYLKTTAVILWAAFRSGAWSLPKGAPVTAIAWSENEKRGLQEFLSAQRLPEIHHYDWNSKSKMLFAPVFLLEALWNFSLIRWFRLAHRLARKYPLFVAGRAFEAALTYSFLKRRRRLLHGWFLISSESNPHGTALIALARGGKTRVAYVAHSAHIDNALPVFFNLGIFRGPAALEGLKQAGAQIQRHLFYNCSTGFASKSKSKVIVALSKTPDWARVYALTARLKNEFQNLTVQVRRHPNDLNSNTRLPPKPSTSIYEDLEDCRLLIAANSTVHMDALHQKIPSFLDSSLDEVKEITLPFLREGLIRPLCDFVDRPLEAYDLAYPQHVYDDVQRRFFSQPIDPEKFRQDLIHELGLRAPC